MRIKKDLKDFLDENLHGMAESHLDSWKDRYFGYKKSTLEYDLQVNRDDSLEIKYTEDTLKRKLSDNEIYYLVNRFHKEVVKQYLK